MIIIVVLEGKQEEEAASATPGQERIKIIGRLFRNNNNFKRVLD